MWPLASRVLQRAARCFGGDTRAAILMKSSRSDINAPEHSFLAGTARGCCPLASDYFGRHSRLFASTIRSRHLVNNSKTCLIPSHLWLRSQPGGLRTMHASSSQKSTWTRSIASAIFGSAKAERGQLVASFWPTPRRFWVSLSLWPESPLGRRTFTIDSNQASSLT